MTLKERTLGYWDRVKALAWALRGDGCTSAPDFFYGMCCDEHDVHYRTHMTVEGVPITKEEADQKLFDCMKKNGQTPVMGTFFIPGIYYLAVKVFGKKAWNANFK